LKLVAIDGVIKNQSDVEFVADRLVLKKYMELGNRVEAD
jgi:hypothetical protein